MASEPERDDVVEVPPADVAAEARLTPAEAIAPMHLRPHSREPQAPSGARARRHDGDQARVLT
jgi:hypothetical protein